MGRAVMASFAVPAAPAGRSRRTEFRDDATVRGDGDALPGFDSADVPTEIVFQLTNAS
jgi:hypothetical protein